MSALSFSQDGVEFASGTTVEVNGTCIGHGVQKFARRVLALFSNTDDGGGSHGLDDGSDGHDDDRFFLGALNAEINGNAR